MGDSGLGGWVEITLSVSDTMSDRYREGKSSESGLRRRKEPFFVYSNPGPGEAAPGYNGEDSLLGNAQDLLLGEGEPLFGVFHATCEGPRRRSIERDDGFGDSTLPFAFPLLFSAAISRCFPLSSRGSGSEVAAWNKRERELNIALTGPADER